jgi:hypothetical protein
VQNVCLDYIRKDSLQSGKEKHYRYHESEITLAGQKKPQRTEQM